MKIRVCFFAGIREAVGVEEECFELPSNIKNLEQLRDWYVTRGEPWSSALSPTRAVRAALNHQMCDWDVLIMANSEIAFFPPVTGG